MIKIDKAIILLYPLGLLLISFLLDNEVFMYSLLLLTSIIIYELFISQNQPYSGIRGIWLLATPSLIFVSYTVFISIPSIYIISTVNHPQALNYYLSILSFYLLFPVGLYYGNKIFPIQNTQVEKMYNMEWTLEMDHKLIYEILIIMLSIIILILCLYLIRVDTIPVFEIIRDPKVYKILFMLREESMKLLNVPRIEKYFYSWSRDLLIPLGIVTSLFLYIIDKKRKYFLLFLIYFSVGIFNNSITVAKLPIAAIFFSLMAMYLLRKRHFSFRMIIASLISIFSIPVMINYIASLPHLRTPEKLLYAIAYRLFVVPAEVLFEYFKIFPDKHPFLLGRSTQLFSWIHSDGNFNTANYVAQVWWKDRFTTGSANAVYIGNFWADFGLFGVMTVTLILGILIHYIYKQILATSHYKMDMIYVTFTTAFISHFTFSFVSSSITVIAITKGMIFIPLLLYFYRQLQKKIKNVPF
jgi:hypothetical protein